MAKIPDHPAPEANPKAFVFPTAADHPETPVELSPVTVIDPSEEAIDAGIEESFPASDPVSVTVSKVVVPDEKATGHPPRRQS